MSVCIVLRKPPYGTVLAAEAVRHALGGAVEELPTTLVLLDSGVLSAKAGQDVSSTGYQGIAEGISDCADFGVDVYAEVDSLDAYGLKSADLVPGVEVLDKERIAGIIKDAGTVMIF
jgi:sulfur relay (sulfurtransferase) DsrF/TusC family protein